MTTVPSTMIPKSSAPRLMRLALNLSVTMPMMVINMDNGITAAVMSAARMFPRKRKRITITRRAPLREVFSDRAYGLVHQAGTAVHRFGEHALRKRTVYFLQSVCNPLRHDAAVLSHEHEHGSQDNLFAVLRGRAGAQFLSEMHFSDIVHMNRHSAKIAHNDLTNILEVRDLTRSPHQELLTVSLDVTGSCIRIVA